MTLDKVNPLKLESIVTGGDSDDDYPTTLDPNHDHIVARGLVVQNDSSNDDTVVVTRDSSGNLTFQDSVLGATKTLSQLASGGGMTPTDHRGLDQLVHELAESFYEEYTFSAGKVTNVTTWETSGKLKKVREEQYTYDGNKIDVSTIIQYDGAGAEVERLTETYAYSGSQITSVTAVRSTP